MSLIQGKLISKGIFAGFSVGSVMPECKSLVDNGRDTDETKLVTGPSA